MIRRMLIALPIAVLTGSLLLGLPASPVAASAGCDTVSGSGPFADGFHSDISGPHFDIGDTITFTSTDPTSRPGTVTLSVNTGDSSSGGFGTVISVTLTSSTTFIVITLDASDDANLNGTLDCTNGPDGDDDGTSDASDNCPDVSNADQANEDGDTPGDACDDDDDNDGQSDGDEVACGSDPLDDEDMAPDADHDNVPDCIDSAAPTTTNALPATGSSSGAPAALGFVLVGVGLLAVLATRRKRIAH